MNKHAIIKVLEYVSHFNHFISLDRVKKHILDNAKLNRKGLTKEEIQEKGLNIYPKTGITIDSLFKMVIKEGYVEVKHEEETEVKISSKGLNLLIILYTNNYSEEFLVFQREVNNLTKKQNETDFNPVSVARMYYHERDLKVIEKLYFTDKKLQQETEAYHNYLLSVYGLKPNKDSMFFHMIPKLFLPIKDVWEDVELTIEGIEIPESMILSRPYPNQRYVVAGIKRGKEKITTGFYPIIANKKEFPKETDIRYHWKLGNGKEIIHDIHIMFQIDRGNLFSTEQSLSRSNNLPCIRVATFVDDAPLIEGNHTIEYAEKGKMRIFMKEHVTLTSFPTHLHSSFFGDKNYQSWKQRTYKDK